MVSRFKFQVSSPKAYPLPLLREGRRGKIKSKLVGVRLPGGLQRKKKAEEPTPAPSLGRGEGAEKRGRCLDIT